MSRKYKLRYTRINANDEDPNIAGTMDTRYHESEDFHALIDFWRKFTEKTRGVYSYECTIEQVHTEEIYSEKRVFKS